MAEIAIEQALYGGQGEGGYRFLARSPGVPDDWLPEAQRLCAGFGERPAGVSCPSAVFAQPLTRDRVAVVQVADQPGADDAGRPGVLGFRLLILPADGYARLGGDPFALADRFPPDWEARGELPALAVPAEAPRRTLAEVRDVLSRHRQMQPTLLGAAQTLVDGGRVAFERSAPDADLLRALWALLPTGARPRLWPASYAFGNALGFDALAAPRADGPEYAGYVFESQAGDYPEGNYELSLQVAAETGDQAALDALFSRGGPREAWRMGLLLLGAAVALTVLMGLLRAPRPEPPAPDARPKPAAPSRPDLPPPKSFAPPNEAERERLTEALTRLAGQTGVEVSRPATAEALLDALDAHLGPRDPARDTARLTKDGSPEWRLRVLLWKHGVPGYNDRGLTPPELVERLEKQLVEASGAPKKP